MYIYSVRHDHEVHVYSFGKNTHLMFGNWALDLNIPCMPCMSMFAVYQVGTVLHQLIGLRSNLCIKS